MAVVKATTKIAPADQRGADLHGTNVSGGDNTYGLLLREIAALGELLDDLEQVRVANGNRVGAFERLTEGAPSPHLPVIHDRLAGIEHDVELTLVRTWRKHPLAPWAHGYLGLGEKSIARLIAIVGDPLWRGVGHWEGEGLKRRWVVDGYEPRTLAQLRAYCGHGDPLRQHKAKGATQADLFRAGNPRAKKQTWLISAALLKAGNRSVYDEARAKYSDAVHERPCPRCGPSGRPAPTGSPLSAGHQHARALRATGKTFLKDLWLAASELHDDHAGQADHDLHEISARVNGRPAQTTARTISKHPPSARATPTSS